MFVLPHLLKYARDRFVLSFFRLFTSLKDVGYSGFQFSKYDYYEVQFHKSNLF